MADSNGSYRQNQPFCDGLEIGAVSVKWVRRTKDSEDIITIERHGGDPKTTVKALFSKYGADSAASKMLVTGSSAKVIFDLPYRSETECIEKALSFNNIKPDILLSLGGETFSLYTLKDGLVKNIISSSKCAAGTGEFIVQQLQRMNLTLEEGLKLCETGNLVQLATRCSVHCKSDATHKLNKAECFPGDIAKSFVYDLAKKIVKMIDLAQWPATNIAVSGGVTLNRPFIKNLKQLLKDSNIIVLKQSSYLEAFGAALFAVEEKEYTDLTNIDKLINKGDVFFDKLSSLKEAASLLDYRVCFNENKQIQPNGEYILGVDAGSTTTKAVLFNVRDGSVGARCYLKTYGNPVSAVKQCIKKLIKTSMGKNIKIIQAGVTGSGREMVSVYLDNCLSFNEIIAHGRAAADEIPDVDTVFEIGGQDSKFISFLNGISVDYAMNEGCSAGTGSFLEESASVDMGVAMEDISAAAEKSNSPIAFGERCAAFINTDLRNALQQGAKQNDVIAGLVYSIADNYISRIVGVRPVGDTVLFQGGVALNRSVALAMAQKIQKKIVVPRHPELMGCVGTALMITDQLKKGDVEQKVYSLDDLICGNMEIKGTFKCATCENKCEIQKISIRDKIYPFGGLCSKYDLKRHAGKDRKKGRDYVEMKNALMFDKFCPEPLDNPAGTIGLPMALTTFALFPFYAKLINELGYNMVLSQVSKTGNTKTKTALCYPCEVVHGAVYDLLSKDVDYILLPRIIEFAIQKDMLHSYTCPTTTIISDIIKGAFEAACGKILAPQIGFSKHLLKTSLKEIGNLGAILGISKKKAEKAGKAAMEYYGLYTDESVKMGKKFLSEIGNEPAVIIAGRPYTTNSSEVNLSLPRKITSRGYHAVPADILPRLNAKLSQHPRNVWNFTQDITNSVSYVRAQENLFLCLVSCFSCGPDASIYHLIRQDMAGETFCYLEIDSHTAHAGFETRVGAFLDIVEERRRQAE